MLFYDTEIQKAVPSPDTSRIEDIQYCEGWQDFDHMGISIICALHAPRNPTLNSASKGVSVFLQDNLDEFQVLVQETEEAGESIVGFNSWNFDDRLCLANNIKVETTYDLLGAVWHAAGLERSWTGPAHSGYGLRVQQGKMGQAINHCLHDVRMLYRLTMMAINSGVLNNPKDPKKPLQLDYRPLSDLV